MSPKHEMRLCRQMSARHTTKQEAPDTVFESSRISQFETPFYEPVASLDQMPCLGVTACKAEIEVQCGKNQHPYTLDAPSHHFSVV